MSHCLVCKAEIITKTNALCNVCWSNIKFLNLNGDVVAIAEYNDILRKLIHIFKYQSPWMLKKLFINWFSLIYKQYILNADIIIPIPMHKYKLMRRGYNHAVVLARGVAHTYKKPCIVNGLMRIKNISSQSLLTKESRKLNVLNSLCISSSKLIMNKKILLIDDVTTTGATLLEASRVLMSANAKSVQSMCVAMTI